MASDIVSPLESTIEKHLDSTSRLVRHVDLAFSLLIVFSLILGGLFLAILADHWLLKDGLSMTLRFGIFFILFAVAAFYIYRKVVPLFCYQINPIYTANLIEKDTPAFKNSLINWLLLRHERAERSDISGDKIRERMYDGIVQTAAVNVQTVPTEHPVDFRNLIRSGTFFMVLLALFIVYAALSPKSPFASLGRVLIPFSGIERPQSAQFKNIKPGNAVALQGETLMISAEVFSQSSEEVYLVFSTDDGQAAEQRIPMLLPEGKVAFETLFPPGKQGTQRGFNSSVDYWIAQGESRSKQYRIEVQPAASIEIVSLQYKFPDYTGLPPETIEHSGDVRALEGTEVSVAVRSTLPLQKIDLVFNDQPAGKVPMKISGDQKTEAKGTFTLKLPSPYKTFAFEATDENGNVSRRSGIYPIEVIPDQSPKVQWADTADHLKEMRIDLPENETLQLPIQAEDPDFALRSIQLKTESTSNKQYRIPPVSLLNSSGTGPTEHKGQITKTATFLPTEKGLKKGDTVEVWAEAADTKTPEANIGSTLKLTINVVSAKSEEELKKESEQNQDEKEGDSEQNTEQQPNEGGQEQDAPKQDQSQDGNEGDKQEEGNEGSPEQNTQQNDPEQNEGEGKQDESKDEQTGKENQPKDQNQKESNPDKQDQPEQEGSEQNKAEQNKGNQNQNGAPGNSDQQQEPKEDSEDSNKGAAGDESAEEGENNGKTQKGQTTDGQQSNESADPNEAASPSDPSPKGGAESTSSKGEGANSSPSSAPKTPVNPETQDGDAMERIVERMKEEGKFDENKNNNDNNPSPQQGKEDSTRQNTPFSGLNKDLHNDSKNNRRDDSLDPNSPNLSEKGNDPDNPQQSNQSGKGSPQPSKSGEQQKPEQQNPPGSETQSGEPKSAQGANPQQSDQQSSESGGESPQKSDQQGNSPQESSASSEQDFKEGLSQGAQEQQGKQDSEGKQSDSGQQQSEQGGQQGNNPQKGNNPSAQQSSQQGTSNPNQQNPNQQEGQGSQQTGGTGGGGGVETKTAIEDANLEYADKVTNLVLEYLEDQLRDKPNDKLLNELGWTEEQLRQFYDKWQKMADENRMQPKREEGKNPWEEALKSLGLNPNRNRPALQRNQTTVKDKRQVMEAQRFEPPAAVKDKYKRYTEGIGK